jgi:hypothetical protein
MNMEADDDDFFGGDMNGGDGSDIVMSKKTMEKASRKMRQEGYVNGKSEAEQQLVQQGFDTGFEQGMSLGAICGHIYARYRILEQEQEQEQQSLITKPSTPSDILILNQIDVQKLLFETLPESYENSNQFERAMVDLRRLCEPLCPTLLSDLDHIKATLTR